MALRALKTEEELAAIPLNQEVLIELPTGVIPEDEGDGGIGAEPEKKAAPPKTETEDDTPAEVLRKQLEDLKAADKAKDERLAQIQRDAEEARRQAHQTETELRQARTASVTQEEANIQSTLQAAQDAMAAAEAELERAGENGDFKAMAKAQAKIGRVAADIRNLEIAAADVAQRKEEESKRPEPQKPTQQVDPMAAIDANPNLLPAEKDWLKAHPDSILDKKRNNELGVGYERAVAKGLVRGTPQYFAYLEEFMGYAKPAGDTTTDRETQVQAPPSRQERGGDGRPSPNRITLTPEQRELARSLGISDIEYAKQVARFDEARKADPDKYR